MKKSIFCMAGFILLGIIIGALLVFGYIYLEIYLILTFGLIVGICFTAIVIVCMLILLFFLIKTLIRDYN